jgi:ribosomal protein S18 acetylase RimI-like enzyme
MNTQNGPNELESRRADAADAEDISAMIIDCFNRFIASDYNKEGRDSFLSYVTPESIASRLINNEANGLLVLQKEDGIVGYIEWSGNHISLLFVHHEYHRLGIARHLLSQVLRDRPGVSMTVNSGPYSAPIYKRLGFRRVGDWTTRNGIRFLRMARQPTPD